MRCSVVAVGTELLLGQIVDTNSSWLGEQLAAAGIDSLFQVKVGDNLARIVATLRSTLADADAIIICGGLGPTHDDITREAIAEILGVELEMNDEVALVIDQLFTSRRFCRTTDSIFCASTPNTRSSTCPRTFASQVSSSSIA